MADECLVYRVRRLSRALTRLYDEALRPLGIHAAQLALLNAVALVGEVEAVGGAPMSRLADVLAMDLTTLSRNVRPLAKAGLVRIERSPADRRVRRVVLTAEGAQRIVAALPVWREVQDRVVAVLGAEVAAGLRAGMDATLTAATGARVVAREG